MTDVRTDRLILRPWTADDLEALHQIQSHPDVAHWLGGQPSRSQLEESLAFMIWHGRKHGWGVRAVCLPDGALIGAAGLQAVKPAMPFRGVEAQWRLGRAWWGKGYATEAMRALLREGFEIFALREVVAFTAASNQRSQAVMDRLGFERVPEQDFDHPSLAVGHPLRRHVFYRMTGPPDGQSRSHTPV